MKTTSEAPWATTKTRPEAFRASKAPHGPVEHSLRGGSRGATLLSAALPLLLALPLMLALVTSPSRGADLEASDQGGADTAYDDRAARDGESARLRFLDGDLTIERYDQEEIEQGTINAPLFAGDVAETQNRGRAEIQLPSGALVRLDEVTRMSFLSVPDLASSREEATVLQLSKGTAQIEIHRDPPRKVDFRIDTPSASIYLLASGRYRIDLEGRYDRSRVSVLRGVAEVVGDDGSVILRSGQRSFVEEGSEPDAPRSFNTAAADDFDGWVLDRSGRYLRADAADSYGDEDVDEESIPDPVRPYRSELSQYGTWTTLPTYGLCWIPTSVASGWRPYYNGYWVYRPWGSFWVSYDPWGWAPFHYGRWFWAAGRGWIWVPGSIFSGGWVSWYYGPNYVGWCPLDFWDYPCRFGYGPSWIDFRCWNFITYNHIYVRNVNRIYVYNTSVRNEVSRRTGVIVRRPLRITPRELVDRQWTPAGIVQRARAARDNQITPSFDRGRSRPFRDREREIARQTPAAREPRGDRGSGRGPSSGLSPTDRGRRTPPAAGSGGERRRQFSGAPAGRSSGEDRLPPGARRSEGAPEGRRRTAPGGDDAIRARPRSSGALRQRDSRRQSLTDPDADRGDRPRAPMEESLDDRPRRAPGRDAAPYRSRPPELRSRPRPEGEPGESRSDRSLREFFRESERRPAPRPGEPRGGRESREAPPEARAPASREAPPAEARPRAPQPPQARGGERRGGRPDARPDGGKGSDEGKQKPRKP